MKGATTISVAGEPLGRDGDEGREAFGLVIAWSMEETQRVGEIAFFREGRGPFVLGRGEDEEGEPRAGFVRQRPGEIDPTGALGGRAISRRQLLVRSNAAGLEVERVGRCPMLLNGRIAERGAITEGDTVELKGQLLLLCVRRTLAMAEMRYLTKEARGPFGEPDAVGILGESPAVWQLRDRLAFAAKANTHVLLVGPSGTGKELAARSIHELSSRAKRPLVSRNAATFPPGLIDAELFGNVKNYPNPGMPERPGLVGQANGGTLFLDEIAELPQEMQAHLLRVLDADGEYQRLGEATARRTDLRLIGATNRDPSALKHDLLARLTVQVELPPLEARREDIPLLVRHLLSRAAERSSEVGGRFVVRRADGRVDARVEPALIDVLLRHQYKAHVRELDALLWRAMAESAKDVAEVPSEMRLSGSYEPLEPSADQVRAILGEEKGNITRAARALGLSSRFALYRLMKKYGIELVPGE